MIDKTRYSWPFILALALHLAILGLFVLSFLFRQSTKEDSAPSIIHAAIVDDTRKQAKTDTKPVSEPAEPERRIIEQQDNAAEEHANAEAETAEAAAKADADAKAKKLAAEKAEAARAQAAREKAEAAARAKADADAKAKKLA
ncbi:MAG: cell envelope integrity protein TolA, partial [Gammaproteobacteria bacterium]